jgi:hypothetical protein
MPAFSIMSGIEGSKGAKKANEALWQQYMQIRKDLAPWTGAGAEMMAAYAQKAMAGPGAFEASPGYGFRRAEGQRALNAVYSGAGALGSGAHQKALIEYGQNFASNEYEKFLNQFYASLAPLQTGAQMGLNAQGLQTQAGMQTALGRAQTMQNEANARASMWSGIGSSVGTIGGLAMGGYFAPGLNTLFGGNGTGGGAGGGMSSWNPNSLYDYQMGGFTNR